MSYKWKRGERVRIIGSEHSPYSKPYIGKLGTIHHDDTAIPPVSVDGVDSHAPHGGLYVYLEDSALVRVGEGASVPDPLIFGASIPGDQPVEAREEYEALTHGETVAFHPEFAHQAIRDAHRAGWFKRRTP